MMNIDFPNNLQSSAGEQPQTGKVMFLHYCPHGEGFDREYFPLDTKQIERNYKKKVDEMVAAMLSEEKQTLNIIPKKANIDLKRSLQPKLDKLRRRTEKTIVNILSNRGVEISLAEEKS